MATHIGLGPVFAYEWLMTSRRWQLYAGRSLFVAILLVALAGICWRDVASQPLPPTLQGLARLGETFFYVLVGTQLALILVAAPAYTAGAICQEKACGVLVHLLVTDLSAAEIVLGKLAARLVPVLGLVLGSLPVLFVAMLLGGIDPEALLGAFLVTLAVAVLGCVLALTLSVWATRTHEVLLAVYLIWTLLLLVAPIWDALSTLWGICAVPTWVANTNPFQMAFAFYHSPGTTSWSDYGTFLGGAFLVSALLLLVAVLCLRRVTVHQLSRPARGRRPRRDPGRPRKRWLPSPSLDGNPILWREWHRKQPSRWIRAVWICYVVLATFFSLVAILWWRRGIGFASLVNALQVASGLLLVSVSSVTALSEERSRGSLDVLLATPLSTPTLVWGKWWGAYRKVPLLAVLPTLLAVVITRPGILWFGSVLVLGLILAYGAAITSLGLALAIWVRRLSWALALSVGAYTLVTVGGIFVAFTLFDRRDTGPGVASASPFFGLGMLTSELEHEGSRLLTWFVWDLFWILTYSVIAALLLWAILKTFDRCLGRMAPSRTPALPPPHRHPASQPVLHSK